MFGIPESILWTRRKQADLVRGMKPKKADCGGCRNDFYNRTGSAECWCFKSAKMESALDIPVDLIPPYKGMKATKRPDCYKRDRFVRVKRDSLTKEGFWKS